MRTVPTGERGLTKRAESTHVFASRAFVTVTLAANMRGGMWTQTVYEEETDRVRPHGPQHVAKEFRSIMRDTRSHIKLCYVQRNFTTYTQPLDRAYMRAFTRSMRREVAKHFAQFFVEAESNFVRANLDFTTSVLQQLLLSFVHTAAQNADSLQHRAALHRLK